MKNILQLALFTLAFCGPAFSEPASVVEKNSPNENPSAALEEIVAETKVRLDLTDKQAEQITPIVYPERISR